jgi:short-subunit dehydrogenase
MNEYALVTGASKGIGRATAIALAAKGYHLLLLARSGEELAILAGEIEKTYQVKACYLSCVLALPGAAEHAAIWCREKTSALTVLVNNAGYGVWGDFDKLRLEDQRNMLRLNIDALMDLSYHLLPLLKQQNQAYILNVASTAAYQAMPTLAVYAASKSFVLSYSRALKQELLSTTVSVSCLSPGPTATGFASRAGMDSPQLVKLANKFNMLPEEVAGIALRGMFRKKAEIIPGFLNKLSAFGARHLPKVWIERIGANLYKH